MNIHFLRHGRTEANERGLYYGSTDLPLTERGEAELEGLRKSVRYPDAELYLASGLRRTAETLFILYGKTPARTIPELNEFDFGDFEMKSHAELNTRPDFRAWAAGDDEAACPNGESRTVFFERISRGYAAVLVSGVDSVVVCHGGVIGALMQTLFPDEKSHYYAWVPDCGRGYSVKIVDRRAVAYKPIE